MGDVICIQTKHQIVPESEILAPLAAPAIAEDGRLSNMPPKIQDQIDYIETSSINVQPVEILLTAALQLVHDAQILGVVEESFLRKRLISRELDELSQRMLSGLQRIRAIAAN